MGEYRTLRDPGARAALRGVARSGARLVQDPVATGDSLHIRIQPGRDIAVRTTTVITGMAAMCVVIGVQSASAQAAEPRQSAFSPSTVSAAIESPAEAGAADASAGRASEAQDPPADVAKPGTTVSGGSDILLTSAYIWRGFVPTDAFGVQPAAFVKFGDVTVTTWSNVARHQQAGSYTEHDLTVDYTKAFGAWSISAGWINYTFPTAESGRISDEAYLGFAHASFFNPSLKVFQDFEAGSGTYVNGGVAPVLKVTDAVSVSPSFAIGFNHHQWTDLSGFSDAQVGVKVNLPSPAKRLSLAPFVNYSKTFDERIAPSKVYWGLGLSLR